jgi:membrane-bound lytic murein transglycosylase B
MADVEPLDTVLEAQAAQPETALSLAQYMGKVIPGKRVQRARSALRKHRALLMELEARYRIEPQIVIAIWAIETDLGRVMGKIPVLDALATLAWGGRRSAFFEGELVAALRLVQLGIVPREKLRGSWAGAMGHGQFLPSSCLGFAVDHDGDGLTDLWGDPPVDGLASIANYLSKHIWQIGQPWGQQVSLPDRFDFALSGADQAATAETWSARGLMRKGGLPLGAYGQASLLLPGGYRGPAFLTYRNFHVLTRYNNAATYAIAVGLLADRIVGGAREAIDWPETTPLGREDMRRLQAGLLTAGFDPGAVDGLTGPNTFNALRDWQKAKGLPADGFADRAVLDILAG